VSRAPERFAIRVWLLARLEDPPPGCIRLITGPRQVGKTTLQLELAARYGARALYTAAGAPEAAVAGFWERFWADAEIRARDGKTIVLLDEVHLLPDWAASLKACAGAQLRGVISPLRHPARISAPPGRFADCR
jgi:predicted AAA+ superfamily ATPase